MVYRSIVKWVESLVNAQGAKAIVVACLKAGLRSFI